MAGVLPAHHISNVCLHAANAVLLFLLFLYMTGYFGRSAIVAFLFALHPAHVESVAWVAERKVCFVRIFLDHHVACLCMVCSHAVVETGSALVVCGFACAVMSKPMAVTLPFTLLLRRFLAAAQNQLRHGNTR